MVIFINMNKIFKTRCSCGQKISYESYQGNVNVNCPVCNNAVFLPLPHNNKIMITVIAAASVILIVVMMVLSAPERNTSIERMYNKRQLIDYNMVEKQLELKRQEDQMTLELKRQDKQTALELKRHEDQMELIRQSISTSNNVFSQQQEMSEYQKKSSNYLAYKAELASTWLATMTQLKNQHDVDQNTVNLKYNELKSKLQLQYKISDTEDEKFLNIQQLPQQLQPSGRRMSPEMMRRYGIRRN